MSVWPEMMLGGGVARMAFDVGAGWRAGVLALALGASAQPALAQQAKLPTRDTDPLNVDPKADPLIGLIGRIGLPEGIRQSIRTAVQEHPALDEARAGRDEAVAAKGEARAGLFPSGELNLSSFRTITRDFSNDPQNIIERSRARQRTDLTLTIQQPLFDFGATSKRIAAAGARIEGADLTVAATADEVALRAIVAWYDVFAYRSLVEISQAYAESQKDLREAVDERVRQGVSAAGDVAEVDSYIAVAGSRLANYRRQLANAEARYQELIGTPPPTAAAGSSRAVVPVFERDIVIAAAGESPAVRAAYAQARAAGKDAQAIRADNKPTLIGGFDAGRYGVFETDRDYDVRARVTLRYRLFGGRESRADQAEARAATAEARAQRVRIEAERDATIAWSDVAALEVARDAQQRSYVASRVSRDVLAERFRVSRGTLISVLQAEDNFFQSAAQYILAEFELEVGRYALMSRMGRLLPELGIDPNRAARNRGDK